MQIDHKSPTPLHFQVEHLIREMLTETKYREGELLPPEARMAEKLEVSRNTVRAAISRLVQEGLLERKAGKGTRYVEQATATDLRGWPSFTLEMERKGIEIEVFSLTSDLVIPETEATIALDLTPDQESDKIIKMTRVRGHEGTPSVYSISWFHPTTKLSLSNRFAKPLYEIIKEKSGLIVVSSDEEISAIVADEDIAKRLECEIGDPVLLRKRRVKTSNKQCIEYNINYYRADKFKYELTLQAK